MCVGDRGCVYLCVRFVGVSVGVCLCVCVCVMMRPPAQVSFDFIDFSERYFTVSACLYLWLRLRVSSWQSEQPSSRAAEDKCNEAGQSARGG